MLLSSVVGLQPRLAGGKELHLIKNLEPSVSVFVLCRNEAETIRHFSQGMSSAQPPAQHMLAGEEEGPGCALQHRHNLVSPSPLWSSPITAILRPSFL